MSVFIQNSLSYEYAKMRWNEPYVSYGLNKKMFGVIPTGIYAGFAIGPGSINGRDIVVGPGGVSGNVDYNATTVSGVGYVSGGYDPTYPFSIAVHSDSSGICTTIAIPPGPDSYQHLSATGLDGQRIYIVADVTFNIGSPTILTLSLVDGAYIDANPDTIVVGYCDVPSNPLTALVQSNFGYFDPTYPRLSGLASTSKFGFMSPADKARTLYSAFDAFVGTGPGATHASINAVMADPNIPASPRIAIITSLSLTATQVVTKVDTEITSMPGVTLSDGGAGTGIQISAVGVKVLKSRLSGFSVAAIEIDSGANYCSVGDIRLQGNTSDVTDNSGTSSSYGVINE